MNILRFNSKEASGKLEKLLLSAIANWQAKNSEEVLEEADYLEVFFSKTEPTDLMPIFAFVSAGLF